MKLANRIIEKVTPKDWFGSSAKKSLEGGDFHGVASISAIDFLEITSIEKHYNSFLNNLQYQGKDIKVKNLRDGITFLTLQVSKGRLTVTGHEGRHRTMSAIIDETGLDVSELKAMSESDRFGKLYSAGNKLKLPYLLKFSPKTDCYTYLKNVGDSAKIRQTSKGYAIEIKYERVKGQFEKSVSAPLKECLIAGTNGWFSTEEKAKMALMGLNPYDVFDREEYEKVKGK